MKTLLLLRHGKSDWSGMGRSDRDRQISRRGTNASQRIGKYIAAEKLEPGRIVCSPAVRTRQTCEIAVREFSRTPEIIYDENLYSFNDGDGYLDAIWGTPDDVDILMIIGHNPSMHMTAYALTGSGDTAARANMVEKYPTAALAVLTFDSDSWRACAAGGGKLLAFVKPRTLK